MDSSFGLVLPATPSRASLSTVSDGSEIARANNAKAPDYYPRSGHMPRIAQSADCGANVNKFAGAATAEF